MTPDDLALLDIPEVTDSAHQIMEQRYFLRDKSTSKTIEDPSKMYLRVARAIDEPNRKYGINHVRDYYNLMARGIFMPNSPCLINAGADNGMLAACFVQGMDDTLLGPGSIMDCKTRALTLQKEGGGVGYNFSKIRERGTPVRSNPGAAKGPIAVIKSFDGDMQMILQGSKRPPANMGILNIDHPDIEEFINCKKNNGVIECFNLSVGVTDDFMYAVLADNMWNLISRYDNSVKKTIPARGLFDSVASTAITNGGDPGFIFIDRLNRDNYSPHLGKIECCNPCLTADTRLATFEGLPTLGELYKRGDDNFVVTDNRVINDGMTNDTKNYGTSIKSATQVFLTQKNAPVYELVTEHGYKIKATSNHRFPTINGIKQLDELKIGDNLLLQSGEGGFGTFGTFEQGLILGMLVSDGTYTKNEQRMFLDIYESDSDETTLEYIKSIVRVELKKIKAYDGVTYTHQLRRADIVGTGDNVTTVSKYRIGGKLLWRWVEQVLNVSNPIDIKKRVPECVWRGSRDFVRGYLQGFFWGDGSVQEGNHLNNPNKDTLTVRLSQSNKPILEDVQVLLGNFGVISKLYLRRLASKQMMNNFRGSKSEYNKKAQYELVISRPNAIEFEDKIGFYGRKQILLGLKLDKRGRNCPRPERFITKIKTITFVGNEDVYCLTQPDTSSIIVNGIVTLQCGESPLLSNEACVIGSINLFKFVRDGGFDFDGLGNIVELCVEFLDNTITASYFPFDEIRWMMDNNRKIGLGFMGLADALSAMNIRYGSDDAFTFIHKVAHILKQRSYSASERLGRERGHAEWLTRRNATTMMMAPTGTISTLVDCSYSIEPHFMVVNTKDVMRERGDFKLRMVSPSFRLRMRDYVGPDKFDEICDAIAYEGTLDVPGVPSEIKEVFPGAYDISVNAHLKTQSILQDYCDLAISKTINLPSNFTADQIKDDVYIKAWRWGLKGVTYYRQGSKNDVIKIGMKNYKGNSPDCVSGKCNL